jgi:hypothetical protein
MATGIRRQPPRRECPLKAGSHSSGTKETPREGQSINGESVKLVLRLTVNVILGVSQSAEIKFTTDNRKNFLI